MSVYEKNIIPQSRDWLHELARSEINGDVRNALQMESENDLTQLIEDKAIEFLSLLRQHLSEYAKVFNAYAEGGKHFFEVKIYRAADTEADFMLFRNQIKLLFSHQSSGVIRISFVRHSRGTLSVNDKNMQSKSNSNDEAFYDICAEVGPFREIIFHYQGHKVEAEQVAKFYFSEFVKCTRQNNTKSLDRDILLDQIKTLLQEKGLNL
jgi:hypothetical protein